MAKLCVDCFEVYDESYPIIKGEYNHCPKADCIGNVIEVDELLLPTIIELNKKRYYTKYCCSGHYYSKGGDNCYIMFEDGVILPNIPNGFKYDTGSACTIRKTFKSNKHKLFKEINLCANELLDWVKLLKENEREE